MLYCLNYDCKIIDFINEIAKHIVQFDFSFGPEKLPELHFIIHGGTIT